MSSEIQQLEAGIQALEAQRALLGDAVVEAMLAPAKARLSALRSPATPAEPEQTLRQVSILFLDIVGSTTLTQHLDPETTAAVMDDALARGTLIVHEHGGKVLQYAGDNILAAFGADEAREDDAERAVHCGLALLALGRELGAQVQAAHGHTGFNVRVGLHTGPVLLGGGVDADGSIRGLAVNIAARMEQSAPPGSLRISHDTYGMVRGLFEVEPQAPMAVKGIDAPMLSYLVRGARPRQQAVALRGLDGLLTPMIGRQAELAQLLAACERLLCERCARVVTIVADAGVGKTRLLRALIAEREGRHEPLEHLHARATLQTPQQAYGLLRDLVTRRFQINDDDATEVALRKLTAGLEPLFRDDEGDESAESHAHVLGHLIGIEASQSRHLAAIVQDARLVRQRGLRAAAETLRRLTPPGGGLLLTLEDMHWADRETLDALLTWLAPSADLPLLVFAFARPVLGDRHPEWPGSSVDAERIDLRPLARAESQELLGALLRKLPELPQALERLLVERAEGNPFHLEELVRMLVDQQAIRTGEAWTLDATRLLTTRLPATLTGVLQARLDSLPPEERRALQQASVIGAVFWDQALAAVDARSAERLPTLVQRELARPWDEATADELNAYAFQHQLLHQATYDTVLKRERRDTHARVARWMAERIERDAGRAGELLGLAAEHFERAGDREQAAEFHVRAAEWVFARFGHDRVLAHTEAALRLLGEPPQPLQPATAELLWRLHKPRERSLEMLGRQQEQTAVVQLLIELAERLPDDARRAYAVGRKGFQALREGDGAAAEQAARMALAHAIRAGDTALRLHCQWLLGWTRLIQGALDDAQSIAQTGLVEAQQHGLRAPESALLNLIAGVADRRGDAVGILRAEQRSLHIERELGHRENLANGHGNLGYGWLKLGACTQARDELEQALKLARANGNLLAECTILTHLSQLAWIEQRADAALQFARQACQIADKTGWSSGGLLCELACGRALLALGQHVPARQALTRVHDQAQEPRVRQDACAELIGLELDVGDASAARARLQTLLDHVAAGGDLPLRVEWVIYRTLAAVNDAGATDWLTRAHSALMTQAAALSDESLRTGFLQNIPWHAAIAAAAVDQAA